MIARVYLQCVIYILHSAETVCTSFHFVNCYKPYIIVQSYQNLNCISTTMYYLAIYKNLLLITEILMMNCKKQFSQLSRWAKKRRIKARVDRIAREFDVSNAASSEIEEVIPTLSVINKTSQAILAPTSFSFNNHDCNLDEENSNINNGIVTQSDDSAREYDSESESEDIICDIPTEEDLCNGLAAWAAKNSVTQVALSDLLHVLHPFHQSLPLDGRTLLCTPATEKYNIKELPGGGSYYHFGIANCLQILFDYGRCSDAFTASTLSIQVNIDGLPIFKSSNYQFWPILGILVRSNVADPFIIGLYAGNKKPSSVIDYLQDFVEEAQHLEVYGILIGTQQYTFRIHSFVCDAPARVFVKNVKGHTAYYGCERCTQAGVWLNKITFPETNAAARTNVGFREKLYDDYHLGECPLAVLSIDLIYDFPLDFMHLTCNGVMRRLVLAWMKGKLNCRLSTRLVQQVSDRLVQLKSYIPSDFVRHPRPLSEVDRFKATEFRQLLIYTGPVVFQDIVRDDVYKHFMLFSVAMFCMTSRHLCMSHCDYSQQLLLLFVQHANEIYGPEFIVYNVHSLIHLADDVRRFGELNGISCFPFENYLKTIKKLVRKPNLPLQQVIRRLTERQNSIKILRYKEKTIVCKQQHYDGPILTEYEKYSQFFVLISNRFRLSLRAKDSCIMTDDGRVAVVKNILKHDDHIALVVSFYAIMQNLFEYPLSSGDIGIYCVSKLQERLFVINLQQIRCKCVQLPKSNGIYAVFPLSHTFK